MHFIPTMKDPMSSHVHYYYAVAKPSAPKATTQECSVEALIQAKPRRAQGIEAELEEFCLVALRGEDQLGSPLNTPQGLKKLLPIISSPSYSRPVGDLRTQKYQLLASFLPGLPPDVLTTITKHSSELLLRSLVGINHPRRNNDIEMT